MYILSKKQWPAFKYNVWQCNGFSCHINNLSKNILSNAIGCGPNAMSYCPLVCNKLFQIKPTVQMVILLRPFLHEYVFTWSSQNYRVGEKKKQRSLNLMFLSLCIPLRMFTKFTNIFELVFPHLSYFQSMLLNALEMYAL